MKTWLTIAGLMLMACSTSSAASPSADKAKESLVRYLDQQRPAGERWEREGERGHNPFPFDVSTRYDKKRDPPLPAEVARAVGFYVGNRRTASASVYPFSVAQPKDSWVVYSNTAGDDGYIELYGADGAWLAACYFAPAHSASGRCEFMGTREQLRERARGVAK